MTKLQITNPLSEETKEIIVSSAEKFFESKPQGFSVTSFLSGIDYNNKTTWHYMRNRKWNEVKSTRSGKETFTSIKDRVFLMLAKAIGLETSSGWRHFDTDNYMMCYNKIEALRAAKLPGCIDGATGAGKSYTIERYRQENPNNTYVVACDGDMSVKDFIISCAEAVGCETEGSKFQIRRRVINALSRKVNPELIIDEAENMKAGSYDGIKAIMDGLKGICGITIVGANNYQDFLRKMAEKNRTPFPQIYSRLKEGGFETLLPFGATDVEYIANEVGIEDKKVIRHLSAICDNMRELGGCMDKLLNEAETTGRPIDIEMCSVLF